MPAEPRAGDRSTPAARRAAAVATATVADAIQRWVLNSSGAGRGLRGGRWDYSGTRVVRFRLQRARYARDVPVSGTATWRIADGAVRARLRLPGRGRLTCPLEHAPPARRRHARRQARRPAPARVDARSLSRAGTSPETGRERKGIS